MEFTEQKINLLKYLVWKHTDFKQTSNIELYEELETELKKL